MDLKDDPDFEVDAQDFCDALDRLADRIHNNAVEKGFWDGSPNAGEKIALMHSELSEALEGLRDGAKDKHLPHHDNVTVELGDAVIRIIDFAVRYKLPLGPAVVDKMIFNATRPHKHGKNF